MNSQVRARAQEESQMPNQIYVWDTFVRLFHWSLVAAFTVAYLTEEPLIVHVWAGYVVGLLIVARVVWGLVGAEHARFSDFVYSPAAGFRYMRDLIAARAPRYLGHSPGGGTMVLLLLIFLAATVVTGLIVYGGEQQAGPLAGMFSKDTGEAVEEAHEFLANVTLALILFHIVGVALASFVHHENLVRAMITGYKRPDAH
jgi:cytochrome b